MVEETKHPGIVYVLSNRAMPGCIKIGQTGSYVVSVEDVECRVIELSQHFGVPVSFRCEYAALLDDHELVEKALHRTFAPYRLSPRREFFVGIRPFDVESAIGDRAKKTKRQMKAPRLVRGVESGPEGDRGIVCIFSNPAMPRYLKVRMIPGESSAEVVNFMNRLQSTGVPLPFECELAAVVSRPKQVHSILLKHLNGMGHSLRGGFLRGVSSTELIQLLKPLIAARVVGKANPPKQGALDFETDPVVVPSLRSAKSRLTEYERELYRQEFGEAIMFLGKIPPFSDNDDAESWKLLESPATYQL